MLVPLSPDEVSCGRRNTTFVEVKIFQPNASSSSFAIQRYEVTYKSDVERFPLNLTDDVSYTDNGTTDHALTNATAGVTYSMTVISRSGHLTSLPFVRAKCTVGQLFLYIYNVNCCH